MAITPDYQQALIWNQVSTIKVINLTTMQPTHTETPFPPPPSSTTNKITFSADSSLAIIEMDQHQPTLVLDLRTFLPVHQVSVNESIRGAYFLNNSNRYLFLLLQSSSQLIDLSANISYNLPFIEATAHTSDSNNYLYPCFNNTVSQKLLRITPKNE